MTQRQLFLLALLSSAPVVVYAQQPAGPRAVALKALVSRGDLALAAGHQREAAAAWALAIAFDTASAALRKKLGDVGGAGISLDDAETQTMISLVGKLDGAMDLCGFAASSPAIDAVMLRMLADDKLLPSLRVAAMTPSSGVCSGKSAFVFLATPGMTVAAVRKTFGMPSRETPVEGPGARIDYGPLRLLASSDGSITAIVFPPLR